MKFVRTWLNAAKQKLGGKPAIGPWEWMSWNPAEQGDVVGCALVIGECTNPKCLACGAKEPRLMIAVGDSETKTCRFMYMDRDDALRLQRMLAVRLDELRRAERGEMP